MITTTVQDMRTTHTLEIEPKQYIKVDGLQFNIGDKAEYDSYNMQYVGDIVSIGAKTVTIEHGPAYARKRNRLSLKEFAWRNYNFNLEKIQDRNQTASYYI